MEIWKDVIGYEGLYEVSNKGQVRTKEGKITFTEMHGERKWKSRILKIKSKNQRDARLDLWKDGKPKTWLLQRIVAFAFLPKIEGKNCVNHIDGNPRNNNVENLEWCDYKENIKHAFENDLMKTNKKIKLVNMINAEELEFLSMSKASEFLGKDFRFVSMLLKKGIQEYNGYKIVKL